jgi:arginine metabolism regulation protein II
MSNEVIESVPDHNPTQALLDLERFDHCSDVTTPFSFFHGPFGVSRLSRVIETDVPDLDTDETTPSPRDWLAELDEILGQEEEIDLFSSLLDVSNDLPVDESWLLELISPVTEPIEVVSDSPRSQIVSHPSLFNDNHEAWSILSYYKDRIVHLISPLGRGQEGAWLSLVMPYAVNTLGELTMSGSANHARLALLNALLSTSAFHLGQNSVMRIDHWIKMGNSYLQKAESHFMKCVEENRIPGVKKNKYKEILMAILSLSSAYVCYSPFPTLIPMGSRN